MKIVVLEAESVHIVLGKALSQDAVQRFALTLQNGNQKSCTHEYNYVVNSIQAE